MIKVAVLGAGAFTEFSLSAYQGLSSIQLSKIYDPEIDRAKEVAQKFKIKTVAVSEDEIINDPEIGLVLVLTPPFTHFAIGKKVLEAKKHALIEKPIAFTTVEAEELIKIAESNQLHLSANLILRFHPFHQKIKQLNQKMTFGQLESIHSIALLARYPADHWYWNESLSGGFFINTYCHFIDLFRYISNRDLSFGSNLKTRVGHNLNLQFKETDASLSINLQVENQQEKITTSYAFENGLITTYGWFPEKMTISSKKGQTKSYYLSNKNYHYQKALRKVLVEITKRINKQKFNPIITHQDLIKAVRDPILVKENSLR